MWRASVATHLVSVVVRILCYTEEKRDRRGGVSERTGLDERKLGKGIISSLGFFHRRWHVTAWHRTQGAVERGGDKQSGLGFKAM